MGGVQSNTPIWISITGWVVIIIGWFIVSWQNNRREERKEVRGYLDDAVELIESLVALSIEYHMSAKGSQKEEYEIIYALARLEEKLKYLKFSPSASDEAYNNLKLAITGRNFQSKKFKSLRLNHPLIESIRDESHDLIRCLERQFLWAFRSPLPDRLKFHFRIFKETEGSLKFPGWFVIGLSRFVMVLGAYIILATIVYVAAGKYAGS